MIPGGTKPESSKPWVEKYRPNNLQQVVAHEEVVRTLSMSMKGGDMPHMLFHGPPGVGKTTVALAFCKQMFKKHWRDRVLEMNASDERGIDIVRGRIKHFCSLAVPAVGPDGIPPIKVIILDEADQMTSDAQGALRRLMETCCLHTRFMILCNYVARLISPIQSRCMKYHFDPLPPQLVTTHLESICLRENLVLEAGSLDRLIQIGGGDMRLSLSWLQMISQMKKQGVEVTRDIIEEIMGMLPERDAKKLWGSIRTDTEAQLQVVTEDLLREGYSVKMMLKDLGERLLASTDLNDYQLAEALASLAQMEGNIVNKCDEVLQSKYTFMKIRGVIQRPGNRPDAQIPPLPRHMFPKHMLCAA